MMATANMRVRDQGPRARIISQAVIILTEFEDDRGKGMSIRSFGPTDLADETGETVKIADHLVGVFVGAVNDSGKLPGEGGENG